MMQIDSTNNFQTLKRAHHVILTLYVSFKTFKKNYLVKKKFMSFHSFYELSKEQYTWRGDPGLIRGSGTHCSWS